MSIEKREKRKMKKKAILVIQNTQQNTHVLITYYSMSGITYREIGDEVLSDAMELLKPAVGGTKLDSWTTEGELVSTKAPVGLI